MADEKVVRYERCTFCDGTGKKQPTGQTCEVCKGTGKMPIYEKKN
jgi:DnaJ-class molecular chaperone